MNENIKKQAGLSLLRKDCLFKECFHKDNSCDSKIIKAHSIQENRYLKEISVNGELLSFNSYNFSDKFEVSLKEIGKGKASIFTGFCKYHDNVIFKPIESENEYEKYNKEQEFIFAYRALAWFYYAKRVEYNIYKKSYEMFSDIDVQNIQKYYNFHPPFSDNFIAFKTHMYQQSLKGALAAVKELEIFRASFNINLERKKFNKLVTKVIEYNKTTPIALSSIVNIEYDVNGKLINDYYNQKKKLKPILLSVFNQKGKTYILISYLKKHMNTFSFIDEQIIKQPTLRQKIILSNMIISYVENFFISPDFLLNISEKLKRKINNIYNQTIGMVRKQLILDEELNIFN